MNELAAAATPQDDALTTVKALSEVSAVFLALTFVGGWSYLAAYYRTFGLNPLELDFSTSVISTLAVYVLYKELWPLILFAAILAGTTFMMRRLHYLRRGWVVVALSAILLGDVVAGAKRGRNVADLDMLVESTSLPNVAFAAKNNTGDLPCVEVGNFGSYDCKLLLHSKGSYYFFLPLPKGGQGNLNLYVMQDTEIISIHIVRGVDRTLP